MRTGKLKVYGVERPLCFSTRVVCDAQKRFGSLNGLQDAILSENIGCRLDAVTWTLARMLEAGERHAALIGQEPAPGRAPTQEDLLDMYGPDDLLELIRAINGTISAGAKREVEADSPNAEATQEGE